MSDRERSELWYTAECECDLCLHIWQGVLPVESDWLECPDCGNMAPSPEIPDEFFAQEPGND